MSDVSNESSPGLRERKKLRTRAMLVDAAVKLCLDGGYEATTVEQIAAIADVSPRTFSRYFPTKDAVFLTLIEDYAQEVAVELERVPSEFGPIEALRQAHAEVLTRVAARRGGILSADRIALMLRIINGSDALRQAAFEFRHDAQLAILARRMGVDVDDRRASLVMMIFSATIVAACADLIADTDTVRLGPMLMVDRLNEACGQLAAMTHGVRSPDPSPEYEPVYG